MTALFFPRKPQFRSTLRSESGSMVPPSTLFGIPRRRHRVVGPAIELAAGEALVEAAPLLEEERDACVLALVTTASNPSALHRPTPVSALPADNDPGYSVEADLP